MAVSHIRNAESHTGTTASVSEASFTFGLGVAGDTPKGVVVFTIQGENQVEKVTAVTYGGASLAKVPGGGALDSGGEYGRVSAWMLGESVPVGAQNVVVTRVNNSVTVYAVGFLLGGDRNIVNYGTPVLQQDNAAGAAQTIDPGPDTSIVLAGLYTGSSTAPTADTGMTLAQTLSGGYLYAFGAGYETTPATGSRVRGLASLNDDLAHVVLAFAEAALVPPILKFRNRIW